MSTWVQSATAFPGVWSERSYDRFRKQEYKKAEGREFYTWMQRQPNEIKSVIKPCKGDPRWAVIDRKRMTHLKNESNEPKVLHQRLIICIDPTSKHAGNIYNDDAKKIIYFKFFLIALGRPFHLVVKTLYHLTLIGVAKALFDGMKKKENAAQLGQRVVRSLMGIIRTPLYELALLIVALSALIITPFQPTLLYDFRALTGQLSHELYWGKRYGDDPFKIDLNPCMRRVANIMDYEKKPQELSFEKFIPYQDPDNRILVALDNVLIRPWLEEREERKIIPRPTHATDSNSGL